MLLYDFEFPDNTITIISLLYSTLPLILIIFLSQYSIIMTYNIVGNNSNVVVTMTAVALVITLLVFSSGLTTISKPTDTGTPDFGGPGYVYTVEYQCGTQKTTNDPTAQPGEYSTNILIHNPFTFSVTVFTKKLQEKPSISSAWIDGTSFTSGHTIGGDGALTIDCNDLKASGGDLATTFFKGVLVISHEITEPIGSGGSTEGVLISQPLFGDESLDVTAAYTVSTASTGAAAVTHFNKVVVKKMELTPSTGAVTSTISELLIPAATGTITTTTEFDIKDAIDDKLSCSTANTICEVISINYAISAGGGGGGASKHVETIKGKLVPFIPRPQS